MKKKDMSELTNKTAKDIYKEIAVIEKNMAKAYLETTANKAKNTNIVSAQKYRLAVMKTVLHQKLQS